MKKSYDSDNNKGISFNETKSFFAFLKHINDVDVAFDFYHIVGTDIDKDTLKQVCATAVSLSSFN